MYAATAIESPTGQPATAPRLLAEDYAHAASLKSLQEIVNQTRLHGEALISTSIKKTVITFTARPYLDERKTPHIWMEAYTSDPNTTQAQLIGMARLTFRQDPEAQSKSVDIINQMIQPDSEPKED